MLGVSKLTGMVAVAVLTMALAGFLYVHWTCPATCKQTYQAACVCNWNFGENLGEYADLARGHGVALAAR